MRRNVGTLPTQCTIWEWVHAASWLLKRVIRLDALQVCEVRGWGGPDDASTREPDRDMDEGRVSGDIANKNTSIVIIYTEWVMTLWAAGEHRERKGRGEARAGGCGRVWNYRRVGTQEEVDRLWMRISFPFWLKQSSSTAEYLISYKTLSIWL